MATNETPPFGATVKTILGQVRRALEGDPSEALGSASSVIGYRAKRLAASEARLTETLGDDHPRVVDLRRRRARIEAVDQGVRLERQRVADQRPLRPDEWLAAGRVIRESGEPLIGFQVIVYDEDAGPDDSLGDELTDDDGEFRAEYHRRDFTDEQGEKGPQLMVRVFDPAGKAVFATDRAVPASSSRRNRFEIVLTDKRLGGRGDGKPPDDSVKPPRDSVKPPDDSVKPPRDSVKPPRDSVKPSDGSGKPPGRRKPPGKGDGKEAGSVRKRAGAVGADSGDGDRKRCVATTAAGERCRNPVRPGKELCRVHATRRTAR